MNKIPDETIFGPNALGEDAFSSYLEECCRGHSVGKWLFLQCPDNPLLRGEAVDYERELESSWKS